MVNNFCAIAFLLLLPGIVTANQIKEPTRYDAFPNPQSDADYNQCNIRERGYFCDPDAIIDNDNYERLRLFEKVANFPNMTKNPHGKTDCERKGISLGIAISYVPSVTKGSIPSTDAIAEQLANKWFQLERAQTNCSKEILVYLERWTWTTNPNFNVGINYASNLLFLDYQKALRLKNLMGSTINNDDSAYAKIAGLIASLQYSIKHDVDSMPDAANEV